MALLEILAAVLLSAVLLVLAAGAAVLIRPRLLLQSAMRYYEWRCGMTIRYIGTEDFIFCYGEKGRPNPDKSSILFIHGFTSSKDSWIPLFRRMPKDLHLIAVDLPGHGATTEPSTKENMSLETLTSRLHQFVELVGLSARPFHIVGTSLGGALSGVYAAKYPKNIERISMACPAMLTPESSVLMEEINTILEIGVEDMEMHHSSLLPRTPAQAQRLMDLCTVRKAKLNSLILKSILQMREPKNEYYLRLFKEMVSSANMDVLENTARFITMPSQILWGENDEIVHVSGAEVLKKKLPQCERVDIFDKCAHAIDMDRPGACTKAILVFRNEYERKKEE